LQSNFSHTFVKIDPTTIEYPQTWTKERQVFPDNSVVIPQQRMVEKSAPLLQKIKERPTFLFTTPEDKMLGIMGMAIDEHKVKTVTQWLEKQDVTFAQIPAQQVPQETKKGLAVFNLVIASIPEQTAEAMTKKFGEVIESVDEYQQKVQSLSNRPKSLKTPEQLVVTKSPITQPQTMSGKPIPMNYPLMMHGKANPIPVDTCIDAMRGYGRTHTTRNYEPYKQYGFKEGDIAIANGGGKQVAFRVGKQYQITPQMISDPTYQQQWAQMEKHSANALPELFTGKQQVWGLHMEPLGDYVDGKIVPFPEPQKSAALHQSAQAQPIDKLRDWYTAADKLGKPEQYKQRIVEVANQFKSGQQLSDKALAAMEKDTQEYQSISRLTQIAQRIGAMLGQLRADGYTHAQGKMYDLIFNAERKDLTIAYKSGEVILNLQSGNVQSNKVTPEILQAFDKANASLDESFKKSQNNQIER
ncbi:hypothetical protein IQ243_29275, partial [Nostocales cyanobacterium LEGE 11386]|nr:hypothetical protein [Nostocales cyanobacterium LEGE 11386]